MNTISVKLWNIIKTTLIEKDGGNTIYGSIKRWAAWILLFYAGEVINAGLMPSGSLHWAWCGLNLNWNHTGIDTVTLRIILSAIGTYILGASIITETTGTFQNYHNVKYGNGNGNQNQPPPAPQPAQPAQQQ